MIKAELTNLHLKLGIAKKKDPKPRVTRPIKPKPKKIPLEPLIRGRAPVDLMGDLTRAGIIKLLPPARMGDFLGDESLLRAKFEAPDPELEKKKALKLAQAAKDKKSKDKKSQPEEEEEKVFQPDPSMAQLRRACTECIVLPFSTGVKCACQETEEEKAQKLKLLDAEQPVTAGSMKCDMALRTYLFYGPQGSGKSLMVRAIATETRALVLDISGYAVADRFPDKKRFQQMLVTTFRVALKYQPAIILIDGIEQYFPGKPKKKANQKKSGIPPPVIGRCSKYKKDLIAQIKIHLDHWDKVAIIATTNLPQYCDLKELKKLFSKKFYFPYPDNTNSGLIFKSLVEKNGVKLNEAFSTSLFTHMSEGLTPGSMESAIKNVLTKRRKADIDLRPLTVRDFIVPLSETYMCSAEEYQIFREFTESVTGLQDRREEIINSKLDPKKKGGKK